MSKKTHYRAGVEALFEEAPFIKDLGIVLKNSGYGWCETELELADRHKQQNGFVHAGVQGTMCDHTAGAAALSVLDEGWYVLSIEYKVNLLRPGIGERLFCRGTLLKKGQQVLVTEAELFCGTEDTRKMIAKATVTIMAKQTEGC